MYIAMGFKTRVGELTAPVFSLGVFGRKATSVEICLFHS